MCLTDIILPRMLCFFLTGEVTASATLTTANCGVLRAAIPSADMAGFTGIDADLKSFDQNDNHWPNNIVKLENMFQFT